MWSKRTGIDYIKSRPRKKEENAYVEERNGHLLRKFVGYLKLDTHEERDALNQAYEALIPLLILYPGEGVPGSKGSTTNPRLL